MKPLAIASTLLVLTALAVRAGYGQSAAAKNAEGNRFYNDGKYREAEMAYLEAQADLPDRPELFYNLGNALIRQKKYDLGLQSLRQAEGKGDSTLSAASWFNSGNALFEMDNYQDAAQAFAQVLRIHPSDRDAKHNLELALKKLEEQSGSSQQPTSQPSDSPEQNKQQGGGSRDPDRENQQSPQSADEQKRPANPEAGQPQSRKEGFSKERALQILDALQNQELAEQRKRIERLMRRKSAGRDW